MVSWIAALSAMLLALVQAQVAPQSIAGVAAVGGAGVSGMLTYQPLTPLSADLTFVQSNGAAPITAYATELQKSMHLIVVSDDFRVFLHEHPVLGSGGRFRLQLTVPRSGHYHLYTDSLPEGGSRQVFRYDVAFGDAPAAKPDLTPTGTTVSAGPYRVTIGSDRLKAGVMTALDITIEKDGKPAEDLHPYLGATAHAVFISAARSLVRARAPDGDGRDGRDERHGDCNDGRPICRPARTCRRP